MLYTNKSKNYSPILGMISSTHSCRVRHKHLHQLRLLTIDFNPRTHVECDSDFFIKNNISSIFLLKNHNTTIIKTYINTLMEYKGVKTGANLLVNLCELIIRTRKSVDPLIGTLLLNLCALLLFYNFHLNDKNVNCLALYQ